MQEKVITIEINNEQELAKINPENIHCVYLGDYCVHFRAFALENEAIVCYQASDKVQEDVARNKLLSIFSICSYSDHYLGMGHSVRMRKEYYKPFEKRIKNAEFYGYRESFGILFDLIRSKIKKFLKNN